jgi:hypothetical protein
LCVTMIKCACLGERSGGTDFSLAFSCIDGQSLSWLLRCTFLTATGFFLSFLFYLIFFRQKI